MGLSNIKKEKETQCCKNKERKLHVVKIKEGGGGGLNAVKIKRTTVFFSV